MNNTQELDWSMYTDGYVGSNKLTPNRKILGSDSKQRCFSREPYAQEMFDIFTSQEHGLVKKDLVKGDYSKITKVFNITKSSMDIEIEGGLDITIDLKREKKFTQAYGYDTVEDFTNAISNEFGRKEFISQGVMAYVSEIIPSLRVSLWQGYIQSIKNEFMEQISNPTKAYNCTIKEANRGGFFVDIMGVDAFMPGSLAAANKITDFQSYIGKTVVVMIEDYLKDMESFIVSHKKYIEYILPSEIAKLDMNKLYSGKVTGTSRYGIFIEFDGIFTGLLHTSKMKPDTKAAFDARQYAPGDEINFYINEVSRDNRIILTEENPEEKYNRIKQFIFSIKDDSVFATVAAVMNFGVIVTVDDISGLIPLREFKRKKVQMNQVKVKDKIEVKFDEFRDDKIVFSLIV